MTYLLTGLCRDDCCVPERIECTLLFERSQRARIPHPCASCSRGIQPGEVYLVQGWRIDGDFFVVKEHPGGGLCADFEEFDLVLPQLRDEEMQVTG